MERAGAETSQMVLAVSRDDGNGCRSFCRRRREVGSAGSHEALALAEQAGWVLPEDGYA